MDYLSGSLQRRIHTHTLTVPCWLWLLPLLQKVRVYLQADKYPHSTIHRQTHSLWMYSTQYMASWGFTHFTRCLSIASSTHLSTHMLTSTFWCSHTPSCFLLHFLFPTLISWVHTYSFKYTFILSSSYTQPSSPSLCHTKSSNTRGMGRLIPCLAPGHRLIDSRGGRAAEMTKE